MKAETVKELRPENVTEALFLSIVVGTVLFKHQDICTYYFETAQKDVFHYYHFFLALVMSRNN